MMIIDAKDLILGRMASFVAKRLLEGEIVAIVNAEQAVISGRREATFDAYAAWRDIGSITNPLKGPYHPRKPNDLVRLTVRGMLPFDKARGKIAYRHLKVYIGVPAEFKDKKLESLPGAKVEKLGTRRFISIGELSRHLGVRF